MKLKLLLSTTLLTIAPLMAPVWAENRPPNSIAQPARDQLSVSAACMQNRAETLPNPFTDVSADHWAFKAVLTMHYCGAFRQAAPPSLLDRRSNLPGSHNSQPVPSAIGDR
jgi:hypothetical protein